MASPPAYTTPDFLAGMQRLMPTGPVWPRDQDAVQTQMLAALVLGYVANAESAADLLIDAFPSTTLDLLPEWEKTLGLPDPCTPLDPTIKQRQAAVLAKFIASGGQSIAYYTDVAAALGFQITITELGPYQWQINAPTVTVSYFTFGTSVCGDAFWSIGNSELECRMRQIMPAHTVLTFNYDAGILNDGGVLVLSATASGYPTSMSGLAIGALWSNGGVVSVVPGAVPDPTAPPVFFNTASAAGLLTTGGANLPVTRPTAGSGQLWNSSGEVWIA